MADGPLTEPWMKRRRRAMRLGARFTVFIGKLTGGRLVSKMAPPGAPPVFLLTTTGRHSGQPRTVPLSLLRDDAGNAIATGTYGGLPTEPAWILNLRADPAAVMQFGGERTEVVGEFIEGEEWSELWDRIRADYPIYEDPLSTAGRDIPLVRLVPAERQGR